MTKEWEKLKSPSLMLSSCTNRLKVFNFTSLLTHEMMKNEKKMSKIWNTFIMQIRSRRVSMLLGWVELNIEDPWTSSPLSLHFVIELEVIFIFIQKFHFSQILSSSQPQHRISTECCSIYIQSKSRENIYFRSIEHRLSHIYWSNKQHNGAYLYWRVQRTK